MASVFDGIIKPTRDVIFPTGNGINRDEYLLIEYPGIIHSEFEEIFYGLEGCGCLQIHDFNMYRQLLDKPELKVYKELAYFRPDDLITYLNDGNKLPDDEVQFIKEYTNLNYDYSHSVISSMSGALRGLGNSDFIKKIIIAFPEKVDVRIFQYTHDLFGEKILRDKAIVVENVDHLSRVEFLKSILAEAEQPITTVITNEAQFIIDALADYKKYKCMDTFFILRNHSENMSLSLSEDGVISFNEKYTDEIMSYINPRQDRLIDELPLPLKSGFARYNPLPFTTEEQSGLMPEI